MPLHQCRFNFAFCCALELAICCCSLSLRLRTCSVLPKLPRMPSSALASVWRHCLPSTTAGWCLCADSDRHQAESTIPPLAPKHHHWDSSDSPEQTTAAVVVNSFSTLCQKRQGLKKKKRRRRRRDERATVPISSFFPQLISAISFFFLSKLHHHQRESAQLRHLCSFCEVLLFIFRSTRQERHYWDELWVVVSGGVRATSAGNLQHCFFPLA